FGGGGHSRAAAGLIKDRNLEDILTELKQRLNKVVHPAITVAQIMSRGPQLLQPRTPLEEVASRMQRFGYEGYPVVDEGKVIGLVTRRAVDRALAHKLNLTAASLMDAGEVTVKPGDSISTLQQLMTDTGWGQIPVVHPESGKVIGIVTRTDLLKILTDDARYVGFLNLSGKLEAALPSDRHALLKIIAEAAHEQHCALYIVGGFVRDLLLEHPSQDFDLVVEGDAIALARWLSKRYGGKVTSHARFGTAKWYIKEKNGQRAVLPIPSLDVLPEFVDLISARTEFYTHPTALPTVERGSIKLDLHRRDFTINTLALRLDGYHYGELHDYWGGLNDLRQRLVRALHSLSFVDDPTRMLRAVRFEQRFGFKIEVRTLQLLKEALELMARVSGDRIRHELDHILDESKASKMIARLEVLGVLEAIHPALYWNDWFQKKLEDLHDLNVDTFWNLGAAGAEEKGNIRDLFLDNLPLKRVLGYMLWFIRLPLEEAVGVMNRLKISRDLVDKVVSARNLYREMPALVEKQTSEITFHLDEVPPLALFAVYLALDEELQRKRIIDYVTRYRQITSTISGDDLREMGLTPGPRYREILDRLRSAWLDREVETREEEQLLLKDLVGKT
ncbi:MAG: CBS domain-containing protein, partial [Chloroflexi bacterium]